MLINVTFFEKNLKKAQFFLFKMYRAEKLVAPAIDLAERKKHYRFHIHKVLTTESNIAGDIPGPSNRFIAHAQKQRFLWEVRRADFEGKEISLKRRPASPQQADRHDIFSRQTTHHSPRQGYQWSVISSAFPPSPKRSKDTPLRPTKNSSSETFEERLTPVSE